MKFTKMQGAGNDYVYVDCFSEKVSDPSDLAIRIADRHFGVGGDGLILIEPSERADAYMHMFNLDGSEGSMCGNGIRCVAKYIYDHGIIPKDRTEAVIDTKSGLKKIRLYTEHGKVTGATVDMGTAKLTSELPEKITVHGMELSFIGIDVGNPHAVYFLSDNPALGVSKVSDLDFLLYGKDFETHPRFPERVNSEFLRVISDTEAGIGRNAGLRNRCNCIRGCWCVGREVSERHRCHDSSHRRESQDSIRFRDRSHVYDRPGCRSILG